LLGHEIFDPKIGKRVLVVHAFIVAGEEITEAARNWLGNKLDASKRSQVTYMDRDDILNLFAVTNLPLRVEPFQNRRLLRRTICHSSQQPLYPETTFFRLTISRSYPRLRFVESLVRYFSFRRMKFCSRDWFAPHGV
jgi:hypothetical protein